jgi:hypothetical protein
MAASRRRAGLVSDLRRLARPGNGAGEPAAAAGPEEHCELCATTIPADHRHLLQLDERSIVCVCESCWALRSGDAVYRPVGTRTEWLEGFELPDELWASFQVPIGLAFFMRSTTTGGVVALYPSPAGATESELELSSWEQLERANPVLGTIEPDVEALIVNRVAQPHQHAIAPIDECYKLVGMIKARWEGISGGAAPEEAIADFFVELHAKARAR